MSTDAAFAPTTEWQDIPEGAILPAGLEYNINIATGRKQARMPNGHDGTHGAVPDPADARDLSAFLENFRPDDYTTFVAIMPDSGTTTAVTFNGADRDAVEIWLTRENALGKGVYFTVNPTVAGTAKKPAKKGITAIAAVWADLDPRDGDGHTWAAERERLMALADELQQLAIPPSLIIDSGNGLQPLWLLADPIEASEDYRAAAEELCARIEASLGALGTHNVDRLLRVPDFVNYPNAKKRERGRGERPTKLLAASWQRYSWRDLEELAAQLEGEPLEHAAPIEPKEPRSKIIEIDLLPDDLPEPLSPEALAELRETYPEIFDLANYDGDQSRQDLALANLVRNKGGSPADAWALIIAVRGDAKAYRRDYIERTLGVAWAEQAPGSGFWPEPLDIIGEPELTGWPELTADCLPAPLYEYVLVESERLGADPCSLAALCLAACSSSCSDAWRIKPKQHDHWTQGPRLWVCNVKDVGGRGTDTLKAAYFPIQRRELDMMREWRKAYADFQERKERGDVEKGEKPPARPASLTTSDATIEAAHQILAEGDEHSKLTVLCDELSAFLGGFKRYDKDAAARAAWLESYDGGPKTINRIQRGEVYAPNWSVVVVGNIQPRKLRDMGKTLTDDGLFQRFMTIHTKPMRLVIDDDQPLDKDAGSRYRKLHDALAKLAPAINAEGELAPAYFDTDARAVRVEFNRLIDRLKIDPSLPTIIRETAPKWAGLLARVALVFHMVELADRVVRGETLTERDRCQLTGPTVTKAATWLRKIVLPNLYRLGFETMPEEGAPACHARWIAGHILSHKLEHITARDIGRAFRELRARKLEETQLAMNVLVDAGWANRVEARRDSERWIINPAVHTVFDEAAAAERARREAVREALRYKVSEL